MSRTLIPHHHVMFSQVLGPHSTWSPTPPQNYPPLLLLPSTSTHRFDMVYTRRHTDHGRHICAGKEERRHIAYTAEAQLHAQEFEIRNRIKTQQFHIWEYKTKKRQQHRDTTIFLSTVKNDCHTCSQNILIRGNRLTSVEWDSVYLPNFWI